MACSMMKAKQMPMEFWGEAVSTAVFILSRLPTKALEGGTPYEAWQGRQPNVAFLRTFGCIGHVKNTKSFLGKLDDRSTPTVFLGYEDGSKAYRLYDPEGGKVVVSRDMVFNKAAAWKWKEPATEEACGVSDIFTIEHLVIHGPGNAGVEPVVGEPGSPAAEETEPDERRHVFSTNGGTITSTTDRCLHILCLGKAGNTINGHSD